MEVSGRMEEVNKKIVSLSKDVERLNDTVRVHDERIKKHGIEIDAIAKNHMDLESDIKIIKMQTSTISETMKDIKGDVKELRSLRFDDHYVSPLTKHRQIWDTVIKIVIGALAGFLLLQMFPFLK